MLKQNNKLYLYDENTILKYSKVKKEVWEKLKDKNLSFINVPLKEEELTKEEQQKYPTCISKIYLPYLESYQTLEEETFIKGLTTKDILKLMKKLILMINELHNNDIYHSDINSKNIMINKELDIKIIDFDNMVINNYISQKNTYYYKNKPIENIKQDLASSDINEAISMFVWYLNFGTFKNYEGLFPNNIIKMPNAIYQKLYNKWLNQSNNNEETNASKIIDDLLNNDYESPKLKNNK